MLSRWNSVAPRFSTHSGVSINNRPLVYNIFVPTLCCSGDDQEEIEVEVGVFDSEIENIGGDLEQEISEDTFDEHDSGTDSKNEQSDEKVCAITTNNHDLE
jgi:hypothetical protein